jgi:hypothetical protein
MSKWLIAGAAVIGIALVGKRIASRFDGIDFEQLIKRMPEDAPPKWMFRNISSIRENTERMLALLEHEHEQVPTPV